MAKRSNFINKSWGNNFSYVFNHTHLKYMSWQVPIIINTLLCIFSLETSNYGNFFHYTHGKKWKIPSKDTASPLSHQLIASSNPFNSTQAVAPVRNNTKKHTITVAQFWEKNLKPLKSLQTRRKKKTKQNKTKQRN